MSFTWLAKYRDNKYISPNDNVPFSKISRVNLWQVSLVAPNNKKVITLELKPTQAVFYRRRAVMSAGGGTVEAVNMLGYKIKDTDTNVVIFLYESDWHVEIGDFKKSNERVSGNNEYKYPIELMPEEQVEITWD